MNNQIQQDFQHLNNTSVGKVLYFDSASTTQKPLPIIDFIAESYKTSYANVKRGAYDLAENATEKYEQARKDIQNFLGAEKPSEIIFTKNTTEALNLAAFCLGKSDILQRGDRIILSKAEHHSNLLPWITIAKEKGLIIEYLEHILDPQDQNKGMLNLTNLDKLLESPTKIIALQHVSNVLGVKNDIEAVCQKAKEKSIITVIDGCQAAPHYDIDVTEIGCDIYAISSHKIYGPSGVGATYIKNELAKKLPPYQTGGSMIQDVTEDNFKPLELPHKFEAGTPPIIEAMAFARAAKYLKENNLKQIHQHEVEITNYIRGELEKIPECTIYSGKKDATIISLTLKNCNAYDLSDFLSERGICIRVGHHCCQLLMKELGQTSVARISVGLHNTKEEAQAMTEAIKEAIPLISREI